MICFLRFTLIIFTCPLFTIFLSAQPKYTANDTIRPYSGSLRAGVNFDIYRGFADEDLANLSAGNEKLGIAGAGIKSIRPGLFESFTELYGMNTRIPTFEYYDSLGLKDNTLILGFPSQAHQDPTFFCTGIQSTIFKNLYEPIWVKGENGTSVNDKNYYALYVYNIVKKYGKYVKFYEVWNEPGFDFTGGRGWLPKGAPGNWWENNPDPCDYKLRAPIFNYLRLLRITYEIVKTIQPDAYVVTSSLGYPSFLDAVLRNTDNLDSGKVTANFPLKGGAYFDGISIHAYPHFDDALRTYNFLADKFDYSRHSDAAALDPERSKNFFEDVAKTYGYDGKKMPKKIYLITETNVPRKEFGDFFGSDDVQKNWIIKTYVNCAKNNFLQMHVFKLAEETSYDKAANEFDLMGLYKNIHYSNKLHPELNDEGIAYSTASKILFGKIYDTARTAALNLPASDVGGAFRDSNNVYTYVIWAKTTIDKSESASAQYSFPSSLALDTLYQQNWDFSKTKKITLSGGKNIALSATPIFLTERKVKISKQFVCINEPINFNAGKMATTDNWAFIRTDSIKPNDNLYYSNTPALDISFLSKSKWIATYSGRDINGRIILQQSFTIDVERTPTANFSLDYQAPFVFLKNLSQANADFLIWKFSDSTRSNLPDVTKVFEKSGSYTISLTAQNRCGIHVATKTQTIDAPKIRLLKNTANTLVPDYVGDFRAGANVKFADGWTDEQLADIAGGNIETGISGVNAKTARTSLPDFFVDYWGTDVRSKTFEHYKNIDLQDILLTVGDPAKTHQDPNFYCYAKQSQLFKNMYLDIWKDNPDGTVSVNDSNYLAKYLFNLVTTYKKTVKFWEIWNNPGWDEEGRYGYKNKGEDHNWWESNPDPCELGVKAPVQHVVRMMRIAYEIIKSQDSTAFVTMSASGFPSFLDAFCRNTDDPTNGTVTKQYPLTGGAYFDALTFTVYPHIDGAVYYYDTGTNSFVYRRNSDAAADDIVRHKKDLSDVLKTYGYDGKVFPTKKMLISEINVPRKAIGPMLWGSDELQKNFVLKSYITAAANNIVQMHLKDIFEDRPIDSATYNPIEVMGLYKTLNTKPFEKELNIEGIAFKSVSEILYGSSFDSLRTKTLNLPANVHGAAFKNKSGKFTYALWATVAGDQNEYAQTKYAAIPLKNISIGTTFYVRTWDFSQTRTLTNINLIGKTDSILLSGTPIFLSEDSILQKTPIAGFTADTTKNCAPYTVKFQNKSTDATQYIWQFSGGEPSTSTQPNPTVIFKKSGNYDVSLTSQNAQGRHTNFKTGVLVVKPTPKADFTWQRTATSWSIQFSNKTSDSYTMQWDFGDSSVVDQTISPTHTYTLGKRYIVRLIATNDCGSDTLTKVIDLKPTATQDIFEKLNVTAYPNPFSKELNIQLELLENATVSIYLCDYLGRRIKNILTGATLITGSYVYPTQIDLPSGYYFLRIVKNEKIYHQPVVKIE